MKKRSTKKYSICIALLIYLTTLICYGLWDYQYQKKAILANIDAELKASAVALKYMLPDDLHDRAVDAQSLSIEEDQYLSKKFTRFVKETGFKYAYTVLKKDGKLYFIISDVTEDPETKRGTYYFYLYEKANESYFKAFETQLPTFLTATGQWGTTRTVMVPETSAGGAKFLSCVDYDIGYVKSLLLRNWMRSCVVILLFLVLTLPIIILYTLLQRDYLSSLKRSEEQYRGIFENAVEGFFQSTPKGEFITVNPAFAKMFGYESPEELTAFISGTCYQFCVHNEDRDRYKKILAKDGIVEKFEFKAKRKDGSVVWVSNSTKAIYNQRNEIIRYEGTFEDITERKNNERELKRLNQFQEIIIDDASIWLNVLDPQGKVLVWNKAAESISGYSKEEVIGHNKIWELCYPDFDYRAEIQSRAAAIIEANKVLEDFETTIHCKNKEKRQISWYSRRLVDVDGSVIGSVAMGRDITEYKRTKEALLKSEEQLARSRKMQSLGLLAGGVAHDLNNVLSGIVSYPELILLDLPENSKYRKPLKTVQKSGVRAAAIVEDLLTIARGVAISKHTLNLNSQIEVYLQSPVFKDLSAFHTQVTFEHNLDNKLFNISGSPIHISKIVMNLVSNAAEAVESGGTVILSTSNRYVEEPLSGYEDVAAGEYAVLSVSDNGSGISSEDLERIFEPFYSKKTMGRSGTGLGLAVVWNIMQDHKGYIDVNVGPQQTTFELYFPVTREKLSEELSAIPYEHYRANGESVLVVDDEESQRDISCEMLGILGYKHKALSSGEVAIEYLKNNSVDLIMLDMIMAPGMSGRETYEKILEIHPGQKSVIVSGFSKTDDVQQSQNLGAGQYLKKPFSLGELAQVLRQELENEQKES
ncbi:MAG: PAS domain S-box-containing protein [Desulforhopalus sp.]|jgi:PAS domain S-box-containing protein